MPPGDDASLPRTWRALAALAGALAVHGIFLLVITQSPVRRVFLRRESPEIAIELVPPKSKPAADDSSPVKKRREPSSPPSSLARARLGAPVGLPVSGEPSVDSVRAPQAEPKAPDQAPDDAPDDAPDEAPDDAPDDAPDQPPAKSLMHLHRNDGVIGRAIGTGGPLGPSVAGLEGALELHADGPMSDAARAARGAQRMLQMDLADDEVTAGLADDYFRELRNHVETSWKPATRQLNDGGQSVNQFGMSKSFIEDRSAWDEMWRAYLDLAKMYANGQRPVLEPARIGRLRELMRSRKGMFRFHAISEVSLTQAPDGKVLTVELPLSSGHPGIDEGVRDAFTTAVAAMADPPPPRMHQGQSVHSQWRLRATWTMIPPTALLSGAGFDITSKGLHIDVPFDIQLKTTVLLLRTNAPARGAVDGAAVP